MPDQTILSASGFINSIGVNTHAGFGWTGYNNLALMVEDLKYLGVTHLRDAMGTSPAAQPVVEGLAAAGYKFDFLVSSALPQTGTVGLQKYIASLEKFATSYAGSISAIEGLNEANHQPFSYNGSSSLSAAAQFQSALYQAVNANATLGSIPVYNLSLAYNDPQGYSELGNMSGSVDYANAHAYVSTSLTTGSSISATLSAVMSAAPGKPVVITETGYTTQTNTQYLGVNETVQAKSILNTLVDAYKAGVSMTYLYELFDRDSSAANTNPEANFGLFNSDGTPKLAATAIHNLTTVLADDGKGGLQPTDPLNYTLSNMPATGNSMVLGKSNGAYELVVWAEPKLWNDATDTELSNPTQTVTVNLGAVHHTVKVYDTLTGNDRDRQLYRRQHHHHSAQRSPRDHRDRRPAGHADAARHPNQHHRNRSRDRAAAVRPQRLHGAAEHHADRFARSPGRLEGDNGLHHRPLRQRAVQDPGRILVLGDEYGRDLEQHQDL